MAEQQGSSSSLPMAGTSNFANLSDSQFSQTWSQIRTIANNATRPAPATAYASPAPQLPQNPAYMRNVQAWSVTPTPKSGASMSSRPVRARATRNTGTSTPAPSTPVPAMSMVATSSATSYIQPTYSHPQHVPAQMPAQPIQAQANGWSNPPKAPLQTAPQALQSTYPSRMKTGVSLLVQPIFVSATSALLGGTGRSTRRGAAINYADPGSGDDLADAGEYDSDDSEFGGAGGRNSARQQGGASRAGSSMGVFNPATGIAKNFASPAPQAQAPGKEGLDKSYLGAVPPARFITAKPIPFQIEGPTGHIHPSPDSVTYQALKRTSLVPIRVEFETDNLRVRDCFAWNINEELITPEHFAQIFCNDLDLPSKPWIDTVANQIRAQLEEYQDVASMELGMDGAIAPEDLKEPGDEMPECRVILSIDVQIANHHLLDHIEWDLLSPLTPEEFARQLCADLGITGEAVPLISYAVHEELMKHKRDAVEWGVIGGPTQGASETKETTPALGDHVEKRDRSGFGLLKDKTGLGLGWGRAPRDGRGPKHLRSVWRDWQEAEEFSTTFDELTAEDLEKREVERERASRRLRRETSKFQSNATGRMRNLRYR